MEYQALSGSAAGKGRPKGGKGRVDRLHIAAEGPANHLPVKQVQHYRQVYPSALDPRVMSDIHFVPPLPPETPGLTNFHKHQAHGSNWSWG
jgi:hypothetical protein